MVNPIIIALVSYAIGFICGLAFYRFKILNPAIAIVDILIDAVMNGQISKEEFLRVAEKLYDALKYCGNEE